MEASMVVPRLELLQVADAVAREKGIERDEVLEAMEQAIQKAGRSKYGHEHDIRASIDRKSGDIRLARYRQVADPIENEFTQISPQDPRAQGLPVGEFLIEELPPIDFGRIAAQTAKQVIVQRVREVERSKQFHEYKDRVGEIINGIVKRTEYGNLMVDLGRAEAGWSSDLAAEEFRSLTPNVALLEDIARKTGGEVVAIDDLQKFASRLPQLRAPVMETWSYPAWHTPAMFAFALACLLAEWGLRRWKGMP